MGFDFVLDKRHILEAMKIGILIYDNMTQLDATGPFECFARIPGAQMYLIAKRKRAVTAEFGLRIVPNITLNHCPRLDVLCIPGGSGVNQLLLDRSIIAFVRRQARSAQYITSVCTGSLLLGAAGLLQGRRATCHWLSLPLLKAFGASPTRRRIEHDGQVVTAGGITAGIDFGLWMAERCAGVRTAREIQLLLQYDPHPPARAGTPRQAGAKITNAVVKERRKLQRVRAEIVNKAAAQLLPRNRSAD